MKLRYWTILLLFGLSTWLLPNVTGIAVMSVDLGTEWMKIAIVSPGVPMEIALNKESKRKTPVALAFRDGERLFGEDAQAVGVRFPKMAYGYLLDLLGKRLDHPAVRLYQKRFPYYDIVADPDRDTVVFQHDNETQFTPEQLLAMLLAKGREFAVQSARQPINEVVLTVPGYFNQAERRALLQAAELAGLKVLQLINDYTAVALNYGIFRRKDFNETAQYIMFYDMGASSTTATLVSYQVVKTKEKGFVESNPQLSIIGIGYDRTLGGLEMQLRLRDYLGRKFNEMKKTSNDVFKSPRALAKLFKEAGRLKNVLSANAEHHAQVENLLDDQDFKLLVTRDDFESLCADLFDRVAAPVERALKSAGLSMDVVSAVILAGAGTRVPKVQERLSAVVGAELGKSLNTDEAAAMGAVYKAADLSTGFKVKKFITKDAVIFPIQVVFEREVEGQVKQVKRLLFGPMNPFPQRKVLTFNKHTDDFDFSVMYADLDHLPQHEIQALGPLNLSHVSLSGVGAALGKHAGAPATESKGVKAHFSMDDSGLLSLASVELVLEATLTEEELRAQAEAEARLAAAAADDESPFSKLGSTISKLFTGAEDAKPEAKEEKPSSEEEAGEDKKEEEASPEVPQDSAEDETKKKEEGKKAEEDSKKKKKEDKKEEKKEEASKNVTKPVEKKPKVVVIKEPIDASEELLGVMMMDTLQFKEAAKRLEALNEFDRQRQRREKALNALEAFVFDVQAQLGRPEYLEAATVEETGKIRSACTEVSEWLDEEGFEADAAAYESRLSQLRKLTGPLWERVREHQDRPAALQELKSNLGQSKVFLDQMRLSATTDDIFTEVEMNAYEKVIQETQKWKKSMEEEQSALKLSDTPKLTVKAINEKLDLLNREMNYLKTKFKIWSLNKKKSEETAEKAKSAETNATDKAIGEDEEEEDGAAAKEAETPSNKAKDAKPADDGAKKPEVVIEAEDSGALPRKTQTIEVEEEVPADEESDRDEPAADKEAAEPVAPTKTEGKDQSIHTEL